MELEEELEKQPAHHKEDKVAYNRPAYVPGGETKDKSATVWRCRDCFNKSP